MTPPKRRLLGPALMTFVMLLVLLGLGTWQVRRLFWKEALLAQIDRAEASAPVPLPASPEPFIKVSVTGTFLPTETALLGADVRKLPAGMEMGARLIEPMRLTDGRIILVDRGWVPLARSRPIDQPTGPATVSGYVRYGDTASWFSPADDTLGRHFYTLDPARIGDAIGQSSMPPFVVVALGPGGPPDGFVEHIPDPARRLPRPPNNHLMYAITWYALAVALLATFAAWVRRP